MAPLLRTLSCVGFGRRLPCLPPLRPFALFPCRSFPSSWSPPLKGGGNFPCLLSLSPLSHFLTLIPTMSNASTPASPYQQLLDTLPFEPPTSPVLHAPTPLSPRHSGNFHIPYHVFQRVLASLKAGEGLAYAAATDIQLDKIRNVVGPLFNELPSVDQHDRALQVCLILDPEVYRPLPRSPSIGTRSSNSPLPRPPLTRSPSPHSPQRPPTPYRPVKSPPVTMYPSSALPSPSHPSPIPVLASLPTKFSELPTNALYDVMLLLRTSPDTAPVTIHPPMWSGTSEYHERHYAMPDTDEPLSQETTIEHALSYLLDLEGDCAAGLACALHGLDDRGIEDDLCRWKSWTSCLADLQAVQTHLDSLITQHTMELQMISNRLRNAHAYPRLFPHLVAQGLIPNSWSPPLSRLLSLRAGAGPSNPPAPIHGLSNDRVWSDFHGTCYRCGEWGHRHIDCLAPFAISVTDPHRRPLDERITSHPHSHVACISSSCAHALPPVFRTDSTTGRHAPTRFDYCVRTHRRCQCCDHRCHFCPHCRVDMRTNPHQDTCCFADEDEYSHYDDYAYIGNDAEAYN